MGFFSSFSGKVANFAVSEMGVPKTLAVSEDDQDYSIKRVPRYKLEEAYLLDPQTFNTVNKSKQLIMQAGYTIESDKKSVLKKYEDFFANIGKVGMRINLHQLFSYVFHDKFTYGSAYIERIYDRGLTEIMDLKMVDPKLMDYARDAEDIIVVDKYQNPVGYVMNVGRVGSKGDDLPKREEQLSSAVVIKEEQIFLRAFRIAHFRMFPFGNRFESVGIIEPSYLDLTRKHKIEDAAANSIHNTAAYPIVGYVGDSQRAASKNLMKSTLEAMQNLSHSRYMVFQHPTKLETLEVKHSDQVDQVLRYFRANQSAASGMALGFSIGTGEAINRSTLSTQQRMLDISLDSEARATAEEFKVLILDELNRVNKYGGEAKIVWGNVVAEEKNEKVSRLMDAVAMAVIAPEEARPYILVSENIKPNEEAYKKHISSEKTKPKKLPSKPFPQSEEENI
jgi:hypothetical protein